MTGWNMPPGCSRVPGDEPVYCMICGNQDDDCVCPECPVCHEHGNPECYMEPHNIFKGYSRKAKLELQEKNKKRHSMRLSKDQVEARWKHIYLRAEAKVREARIALNHIKNMKWPPEPPQDMGEGLVSDKLEDQLDPHKEVRLTYEQ